MIQLKPGIPPPHLKVRLNRLCAEKTGLEKKKKSGLRFERVFSDADVAPSTRSNGKGALRKSPTTAARSSSSRRTSKCRKAGARSRRKSRSRNISTATSRTARSYKGGRETSVRQLVHRVTRTIADWGIADGYFADAEARKFFTTN